MSGKKDQLAESISQDLENLRLLKSSGQKRAPKKEQRSLHEWEKGEL